MKTSIVAAAGLAAIVSAQRPADMSICDYYTTALLKTNNATTQATVLTLVVNTVVIGNYTQPNVGIAVPGILANGTGDFEGVSLLPYFSGALASTNAGGSSGISVNFLDGGGAAPLKKNMPADDTSSAQYKLLTHLYSYFGYLLGCSEFANTTGVYAGSTSMYSVHKFMGLSNKEVGYFINQVGLAAESFGVTKDDAAAVGKALEDAFGYKCAPPAAIPASAPPALQAICIADDCPLSPNSTCAAYAPVMYPTSAPMSMSSMMMNMTTATATSSMMMPTSSMSMTGTATMSMTGTASMAAAYTGAAMAMVPQAAAGVMGAAAMFLL